MKILKNLGLSILLILFVLTGSIFILGQGIQNTLLKISFYKKAIEKIEISPILIDTALLELEEQLTIDSEQITSQAKREVRQSLRSVLAETLDEEWTKENIVLVIDDFLSYLKGEQDNLTAVIDLEERKEILNTNLDNEIQTSIEAEVDRQVRARSDIPPGAEQKVRSQIKQKVENELSGVVGNFVNEIPNKIAVANLLQSSSNYKDIKIAVSNFQKYYNLFNVYSYLVLAVLIILILVLAGVFGSLKWLGSGMIVSGVLTSVILLGTKMFFPLLIDSLGSAYGLDKLSLLIDPFYFKMFIYTFIYAGLGVLLLILGFVLKRFKEEK